MKHLILMIFLVGSLASYGQANDTTKYFKDNNYGTQSKRAKVDSILILPNGTVINRTWQFPAGSIDTTNRNTGLKTIFKATQDSIANVTNLSLKESLSNKVNVITTPNSTDYPTTAAVNGFVASSISGKVNKWERWTDTFFIQKYDTNKTALTIRVDTNLTSKPTIQILDSINRPLFEMRAGNKRFNAQNVFLGVNSGKNISPISYNSAVYGLIVGGSGNVGLGNGALEFLKDGNENTAIGNQSMQYAIGANGGDPNFRGSLNTASGSTALQNISTGTANGAFGQKAGWKLTGGSYNNFFGKSSGEYLTSEDGNNFIGAVSGKFAVNSSYSVKFGHFSGIYQGGGYNISLGANSASDTLYYSGGPMYVQNTFIAGGVDSLSGIYDVYFGNGAYSKSSPNNYKIRGTNGFGTNIKGGDVSLWGGLASGNATSGSIRFLTGKPISSGTQQHYAQEAFRINGSNGFIGINDNTPSEMLSIDGGTGMGLTYGKVKFAMSQENPQVKFYNIFGGKYHPWYLSTGRGTRGRAFSIMRGAAAAVVGAESMSDALTVDTLGVVGIGTATPVSTTRLELQNNSTTAATTNALRLTNNFNTTGTGVGLEFMTNTTVIGSSIVGFLESGPGPQHSLKFNVQGSQMLHIENGFFGSHARFNTSKVGIGTTSDATTLAALHVISPTLNQQRLGFDASNFFTTAVSSTGGVTFNAVGANQKFVFSDTINATSIQRAGGTPSQILAADGSVITAGSGVSINSGVISATTSVFGGTISATVTAATTFVVTIPTQANNTYQISVQGGNMVSVGGFVTNKTTTSFDYIVPAAITGTVQFDWILKP